MDGGRTALYSRRKRRAIGIRAADLHHIEVDIPPTKEKDMTMEVKDLTFSYRKHPVFHDISFRAYAGDLIAIVGHNGIGKTTLSNILCGMQKEKRVRSYITGQRYLKAKGRILPTLLCKIQIASCLGTA